MSGIFGVLTADGGRPAGVEGIGARMALWGGDGERGWEGRGIRLGHVHQASTSGLRGGPARLPEADSVVVTADVRLDNRADLCESLRCALTAPDEELVLHAYLRFGDACAERLSGAFAIAVWDGRARRLLCARDHAGFRPFAYWEGAAGFVFATDAEAVVAYEGVPFGADEAAAVARFAHNSALLRERSLFEGVAKLPPGEMLVVEPGRPSRRARHWFPERTTPRPFASPDACADALRETLALAAADAADCPAPVGTHLSGGLDSSVAATLAQRALERDGRSLARAFSWSPPADPASGEAREHDRIETIARALAVPVDYTTVDEGDLRAEALRDEALEPNEMLVYEGPVLAEAARHGIGALVTGWGGDEVASFNGRGQLAWLARRGRLLRLWREAAAPARRRGDRRVARAAVGNLVKFALPPLLPDAAYHALGLSESRLDRDLRRHGQGWASLHRLAPGQRRDMRRRHRIRPSPRATQLSDLRLGHLENRIESWARAGARHGVDHRYPLLDKRVLELCLSMPEDVWLRDGWSRWVFRQAVAPLLPASVVWTREKEEPVRMRSWVGLLANAELDAVSGRSELVRAHRRRQQEAARILTRR